MDHKLRRQIAKEFAANWQGRGYEKGDTATFWNELLRTVVGMQDVTNSVFYEQRALTGGFIDVSIPDAKTIIEQKTLGVDLDKKEVRQGEWVSPFEQALNYANSMPNSKRPNFIIVSNFDEFRIHDLDTEKPAEHYLSFKLAELPDHLHMLDFLIDPQYARFVREEKASMAAGQLISRLYQALSTQFIDPESEHAQHSLNVLCVRLVFCLYAEDAGIFEKDAIFKYLSGTPASKVRGALKDLFAVLDTPHEERDPYLEPALLAFPYVNGGLFRQQDDQEIPQFTDEILHLLLEEVSRNTNWAEISPTIFGGVFESTLNPETRARGGMHYTSPENIHRVIDPLFLDGLKADLNAILQNPKLTANKRKKDLLAFQDRIASLKFFDPACGSGNFLTETYISLRRLENTVLANLFGEQITMVDEATNPLKVSLDQFYGIEINDFAVSVASTALWIAQLQANVETQDFIAYQIKDLPLTDAAHLHHGNALSIPWKDVVAPDECSYIIGNPPFLGYTNLSPQQKEDRVRVFGKAGGLLDYVACWHRLAAEFMEGTHCEAALVSTNSICQGQQVAPLWKPLFDMGIVINFAHKTFTWMNEAADQASVFCIIVGFSYVDRPHKWLWNYRKSTAEERAEGAPKEIGKATEATHINAYLVDAPDAFIQRRTTPISDTTPMVRGIQPTDGQNLLLTAEQREQLLKKEPGAAQWIRKFSMGAEFIKGIDRYCLWLPEITAADLRNLPEIRKHIDACGEWRLQQTPTGDAYKLADRPHLLRPLLKFKDDAAYIGVPKVSSERRKYIPMGFVVDGMIPGDKLFFIPTSSVLVFGILMSNAHNAWMRTVGGRLKSDYSYANTIIYNNFVFPDASDTQREAIEAAAHKVLEAREMYQGSTLADLYDPDNEFLYPALVKAHQALDRAVEEAYGLNLQGLDSEAREQALVAHLFKLYAAATE